MLYSVFCLLPLFRTQLCQTCTCLLLFLRTSWQRTSFPRWTAQTGKHKRFDKTSTESFFKDYYHYLKICLNVCFAVTLSDGLSVLRSSALPGRRAGQRGRGWQSWGLDQSDSLPTGLCQWPAGSALPRFRNRCVVFFVSSGDFWLLCVFVSVHVRLEFLHFLVKRNKNTSVNKQWKQEILQICLFPSN